MSQNTLDLIPSAVDVQKRIHELNREKHYLQRLLNIIRDRSRERMDAFRSERGSR